MEACLFMSVIIIFSQMYSLQVTGQQSDSVLSQRGQKKQSSRPGRLLHPVAATFNAFPKYSSHAIYIQLQSQPSVILISFEMCQCLILDCWWCNQLLCCRYCVGAEWRDLICLELNLYTVSSQDKNDARFEPILKCNFIRPFYHNIPRRFYPFPPLSHTNHPSHQLTHHLNLSIRLFTILNIMGNTEICKECETTETSKDQSLQKSQARQVISLTVHKNTSPNEPNNHIRIEIMEDNRAKITYEKGEIYEGEIKDRMKHGKGRMYWPSGSYYEGNWQFDKPKGQGKYFDGNSYEGIFQNNSIVKGKYMNQNQTESYEGEFKDKKFNGLGKLQKKGKFVYEGEFKDNLKNGKGKLLLEDGTTYQGEFLNNKIEGYGEYTTKTYKYEGYFKNGVPHGKGKYTWANGNYYDGDYQNGEKHGYGVYVSTDGARYEGNWSKGKRHGPGVEYSADGEKEEVNFIDGQRQAVSFRPI